MLLRPSFSFCIENFFGLEFVGIKTLCCFNESGRMWLLNKKVFVDQFLRKVDIVRERMF